MATTPVDLYRRGNSTAPRMDNVRPKDVQRFTQNGVEWVSGCSGGISTFANPTPPGTGRIWKLAAGEQYSDELHLENDHGDHWSWQPAHDMETSHYQTLLADIGRKFS